jgi:hypothetical protein
MYVSSIGLVGCQAAADNKPCVYMPTQTLHPSSSSNKQPARARGRQQHQEQQQKPALLEGQVAAAAAA